HGHRQDLRSEDLPLGRLEHLRVAETLRDPLGVEQHGRRDQRPGQGAPADLVDAADQAEALLTEDLLEAAGELPYRPWNRFGGHTSTNAFPMISFRSTPLNVRLSELFARLSPITQY